MTRWRACLLSCLAILAGHPLPATAQEAPPPDADNARWDANCQGQAERPGGQKKIGAPYPFDVSRIAWALGRLDFGRRPYDVSVLIVDNGFAGYVDDNSPPRGSKNFPENFFYTRAAQGWLPSYQFVPLVHQNLEDAWRWGHGTHVTGVVLGGMYGQLEAGQVEPDTPDVRRLFFDRGVGPASNPDEEPGSDWLDIFVASLRTNSREWDTAALLTLTNGSQIPKSFEPDIVNMSLVHSLGSDDQIEAFRRIPQAFPNALLVVSAGNADRPLQDSAGGQYPAMSFVGLGNLLVVGSHDSNMKRSPFSNYHPLRVTLAAPGCRIKSWVNGTDAALAFNGTSQATAIVSFAAALLRSRWDASPNELRERLILSSRYSNDLARGCSKKACVLWGNVLDIEMALYINVDAIEYCVDADGDATGDCATRLVLGQLRKIPDGITTCEESTITRYDHGPSGVPPSTSIRQVSQGKFQVIYQKNLLENGDTLGKCMEEEAVTQGEFQIMPLAEPADDPARPNRGSNQPDGAVAAAVMHLSASRVVRVVTRAIAPRD